MARKILIVDDDLETVKLVGLMLERRGYDISAAQSGAQALAKVQEDDPDLMATRCVAVYAPAPPRSTSL